MKQIDWKPKEFVLAVDRTNEFLTNSGELIYPLVVEGDLRQAQQKVKDSQTILI
jgi:hypothetical protein